MAKQTRVTVNWNGPEVDRVVQKSANRLIRLITVETHNEVKRSINRQGPTKTNPRRRPSAPGEPPKKRTSRLITSISFRVRRLTGFVGSSVIYSRFLELGTRMMAARPFLRPALLKIKRKFSQYVRRVRLK